MDNRISDSKTAEKTETNVSTRNVVTDALQQHWETASQIDNISQSQSGQWCPNCGAVLEARKCKLFCHTPGCGYLVTCSEW
jgi:NADH pyrophosphatase NudC (nudix superfamily)